MFQMLENLELDVEHVVLENQFADTVLELHSVLHPCVLGGITQIRDPDYEKTI